MKPTSPTTGKLPDPLRGITKEWLALRPKRSPGAKRDWMSGFKVRKVKKQHE